METNSLLNAVYMVTLRGRKQNFGELKVIIPSSPLL